MNIFQQTIKSLYAPKTIATFRFQKVGKTILFIFLLSFISFLPSAFYMGTGVHNGLNALTNVTSSLPPFSIENGSLQSENEMLIEQNIDGFILLFDPSGTLSDEDVEVYHNAIGFLNDGLTIVLDGMAQTIDYSIIEGTMTKEDIAEFIKQVNELKLIILSVLFFLLYFTASFAKYIEITILALIGILFKNKLNKRLNFKQIFTLSAYAVTLSTVFFALMDTLQTTVPLQFSISWFIHLTILFLTFKEIPSPKIPNE
ncbi:DUF1189 domain-containing protein [Bacillus kexueae]|uniref:DUF1189 domain-containing protein n=1 Tax=Aeribacillus kexueae TaxID=2078952 RepID=UPI001FAEB6C0|nr:DUF1189 domain-containing protein [Bacillus kexueae]